MHIIVVGAGEVGSYVADRLSREGHDVAVIDVDEARLQQVAQDLDVLTVAGSGTHPATLRQAGLERCDLVVAATSDDEVNLVTSMIAKQGGVESTIVRIEAPELMSDEAEEVLKASGADLVIDPDSETAKKVLDILEYPGASEVASMLRGEVVVIGARLSDDAPLAGMRLSEVAARYEPEWQFLVGAITRGDETIIPRGDQMLEAHDLLRVVCRRSARREIVELLGLARDIPKRIILLGGGRTAFMLADKLSARGAEVVLIERNPGRARFLAERLDHVLVLQGEITDVSLLIEARIEQAGAVVALTGEDHANVLACLYAKMSGAQETVAVTHNLQYLKLLDEIGIDSAISPRTASANGVLQFVRGVAQVQTFLTGDAEVLEFEVADGSVADGATVAELNLPKEALIGAIVRDGKAQIARGRSSLRKHDHLVLFAMPQAVDEAARLFA